MITRIVKLEFKEEHIEDFRALFYKSQPTINSFHGCQGVTLMQDITQPTSIFTISKWHSQQDLDRYRASDFFDKTWRATKILFNDKPQAWSVEVMSSK